MVGGDHLHHPDSFTIGDPVDQKKKKNWCQLCRSFRRTSAQEPGVGQQRTELKIRLHRIHHLIEFKLWRSGIPEIT